MKNRAKKIKAQVLSEYAISLVFVLITLSAMGVYVRRALQARIYAAKKGTFDIVRDAYVGPGTIAPEYEPYYANVDSLASRGLSEEKNLSAGGTTGIFKKNFESTTEIDSRSQQAPPSDAD